MVVQNRTPHMRLHWLSVADVARRLGLSRWAAIRKIKQHADEMGATCTPFDERRGGHWKIHKDSFEAWLAARGIAA